MKLRTRGCRLFLLSLLALALAREPVHAAAPPPSPGDAAMAERGRMIFIRCAACHSLGASASVRTGPRLDGIIGRRVASVAGFPYTARLREQSFVWTQKRLEQWLRKPQAQFPGMCVPFAGLPDRNDRDALLSYPHRSGG